jgi:hypothetical protein
MISSTSRGNWSMLPCRFRRRARGAADAQIDAIRVEGRQRAELLGDDQRGVVGQHDAAGPDADSLRLLGHMADHDAGRGAGDALHVVVLGQPEAFVAEPLGGLGQGDAVGEGLGGVAALGDGRQIEDGELGHGLHIGTDLRRIQQAKLAFYVNRAYQPRPPACAIVHCTMKRP